MRLSPGQRRVLLDLAVGKALVRERGRFFFPVRERVTIYARTVARLAELGYARVAGERVTISEAGVHKAQAMKKDPPRYASRWWTEPVLLPTVGEDLPTVQTPLPGC